MSRPLPPENRVLHLLGAESLALRRVPLSLPAAGELLLEIEAATTCGTDLKVFLRGGHPTMLRPPCPFGHELSGRVAACGEGVTGWREGDAVVVANSAPCRSCPECSDGRFNLCRDQHYLNGAFGEYLLLPRRFVSNSVYERPAGLPAEVAALSEPLACVLHGVDGCGEVGGREVLVLGAGPIGQLFVIELSHRGARVVLADRNQARLQVGLEMGASAAVHLRDGIDHRQAVIEASEARRGPAVVVEATGSPVVWALAMELVRPGGVVVLFGGCAKGAQVPLDTHRLHYSELCVRGVYHHLPATFAAALERLAAAPELFARLIDMRVGLDGVEDALRRMAAGGILKAAVDPSA